MSTPRKEKEFLKNEIPSPSKGRMKKMILENLQTLQTEMETLNSIKEFYLENVVDKATKLAFMNAFKSKNGISNLEFFTNEEL